MNLKQNLSGLVILRIAAASLNSLTDVDTYAKIGPTSLGERLIIQMFKALVAVIVVVVISVLLIEHKGAFAVTGAR